MTRPGRCSALFRCGTGSVNQRRIALLLDHSLTILRQDCVTTAQHHHSSAGLHEHRRPGRSPAPCSGLPHARAAYASVKIVVLPTWLPP
ncbi:hypothetical protein Hsero_0652 [Herbaspirillum seropedicae SmR1]|uniref:Uncharacterized protein n=1 Tax=Herbaspirillum seropedicae (strain SmR1) TaxID=757424 RepID=D8IYL1_HERSS|nr:hypothetical protein Hsero_0652 [Herbaspirillum seropedicae SmR1]